MTDNNNYQGVSMEAQKKLLDTMNDMPTIIKFKEDKEVRIKALRVYSRNLISQRAWHVKHTEANSENIIVAMAQNVEMMSEVIAIILLNDKFTKDKDNNEKLIKDKALEIQLQTDDFSDWGTIMITALQMLDVNYFFQITALLPMFLEMTAGRKQTMEEQGQSPQEPK